MNSLDVRCKQQTNEDGETYYDVEFYIDGHPFLEMVREFESSFAKDLAGSYANIYFRDYTEDFLLGRCPEYGARDDKTELLGCICGCRGCWPLAVRIRVEAQTAIWEDFEQPHLTWNYAGFGPFTFDLAQYKSTIGKIPKA